MRNEFVEIYVVGDIIKLLGKMQVVTKKTPRELEKKIVRGGVQKL